MKTYRVKGKGTSMTYVQIVEEQGRRVSADCHQTDRR